MEARSRSQNWSRRVGFKGRATTPLVGYGVSSHCENVGMSRSSIPSSDTSDVAAPVVPLTGFMRLLQVLALVPVSKSTLWRHVLAGTFTAPCQTVRRRDRLASRRCSRLDRAERRISSYSCSSQSKIGYSMASAFHRKVMTSQMLCTASLAADLGLLS